MVLKVLNGLRTNRSMPQISLEHSRLAQTVIVSAVMLASLMLLGFVLAYWTWVWLAPRVEPRQEIATDLAGRPAQANALFGSVQRNGNLVATTGIAIKLFGVMAAPAGKGQRSYAVLQLDGKQSLAIHEGEDISPGVRLVEVHSDHVILERKGVREKLTWPEKNTVAPAPTFNNVQSMPNAASRKD